MKEHFSFGSCAQSVEKRVAVVVSLSGVCSIYVISHLRDTMQDSESYIKYMSEHGMSCQGKEKNTKDEWCFKWASISALAMCFVAWIRKRETGAFTPGGVWRFFYPLSHRVMHNLLRYLVDCFRWHNPCLQSAAELFVWWTKPLKQHEPGLWCIRVLLPLWPNSRQLLGPKCKARCVACFSWWMIRSLAAIFLRKILKCKEFMKFINIAIWLYLVQFTTVLM